MATVVLPLEVARRFASGETEHQITAGDARALVRALDEQFPGIAARLNQGFAVAIDGEIFQDWFLESIQDHSEVFFLPAIEGG